MATLAPLAIKLVANMEKAEKDFAAMSKTIASIEKSAKTASPSMKNLTDAVKGLGMMQNALKKAEEVYNNEPLIESKRLVDETTAAYGNLKSTVQNLGQGVSDDILQMKPTIGNVQKAQQEVEKLKALQTELGANGHLLNDSLQQAQANMSGLQNQTLLTNAATKAFKTTLNGLNTMPFMVLSVLLADILKGMKGFLSDFNEKFGGMPAKIAQVSAALGAIVVLVGLLGTQTTALGVQTSFLFGLWKSSMIHQGLAGALALTMKCVAATAAWLTAQLGLNTAWAWFLGATGIGLILVAVGALVACVTSLTMGWSKTSDTIEEASERVRTMEDRVKSLADSTNKALDIWRQYNNVAKNALESLMSPAEQLSNQLKELNNAFHAGYPFLTSRGESH